MRTGHPPPLPSDCPQVQCVHPYVAQQPDELTLELADILNILDKTEDGKVGAGRPPHPCPALHPAGTSLRRGGRHSPRWRSWPMGRPAPARQSPLPGPPSRLLPGPLLPAPRPVGSAPASPQARPEPGSAPSPRAALGLAHRPHPHHDPDSRLCISDKHPGEPVTTRLRASCVPRSHPSSHPPADGIRAR